MEAALALQTGYLTEASTMKAMVQDSYGPPDVLALREIDKPVVGANEVLVRVVAAALNGAEWHLMRGLPYVARLESGLRKPKRNVLGLEMAGRVEAVGAAVERFQAGDEVLGWTTGAFAEYVSVAEDALVHKPANLSFDEAATVPGPAVTALQALRDRGGLKAGQKVLINGASGGVGSFAVQIAKFLGGEVTGVASTKNLELVRSLGADHVIDYTTENFADSGARYDVILDLAESHSLADFRRALTPRGTLVMVGSAGIRSLEGRNKWFKGTDRWIKALLLSPFVRQRLRPFMSALKREDLETVRDLIEAGTLTPVVDRTYPLSETAEAIRYTERHSARGKIVITV